MDGQMDGWKDGWTDGWMGEWKYHNGDKVECTIL
jgi:hypothetical protein